jgi:hypothetical protein
MNVCVVITCHGNAVKGFWVLWDNTTLDVPIILDGQFTSSYIFLILNVCCTFRPPYSS